MIEYLEIISATLVRSGGINPGDTYDNVILVKWGEIICVCGNIDRVYDMENADKISLMLSLAVSEGPRSLGNMVESARKKKISVKAGDIVVPFEEWNRWRLVALVRRERNDKDNNYM